MCRRQHNPNGLRRSVGTELFRQAHSSAKGREEAVGIGQDGTGWDRMGQDGTGWDRGRAGPERRGRCRSGRKGLAVSQHVLLVVLQAAVGGDASTTRAATRLAWQLAHRPCKCKRKGCDRQWLAAARTAAWVGVPLKLVRIALLPVRRLSNSGATVTSGWTHSSGHTGLVPLMLAQRLAVSV